MEEPQWMKVAKQNPGQSQEFQVRVHVIESRDLQPRDKNGMSDPVCFVNICDQKKNTVTMPKTTSCTWDHLMFFEFKMAAEEFFRSKIAVTVFDANTILRNVEIGSYEFDISYVYEQNGHELYRKWVALTYKDEKTDIRGKSTGIQGYLKLSITVLGPKDVAPAHDDAEELDDETTGTDLQSMILLPPTIKTQDYSLDICAYKGEGLPKLDQFGKCDGFVGVKFGGSKELVTEVIKSNFSPVWLENLSLPFTMPTMADQIQIQVRDWDQGATKDDIVGTFFLRLNEVMNGPTDWKLPRWVNLYGVPEGTTTTGLGKQVELANKMNEGFIEGSAFRGRILLSAQTRATTDPKPGKSKVTAPTEPATTNYWLRFDLFEAAELQSNSDVSVEVTLGLFSKESKKANVENGNATWYASFDDIAMSLPQDRTQVPDVFINVYKHSMMSKKRIGYIRLSAKDLDHKFAPKWMLVTTDIFSDADKSQTAGFLQFNLSLAPSSNFGARQPIAKPQFTKYVVRAHIYQGRELPSGDKEGSSDPYCVVRVGKSSQKTSTIKETIYPVWYETLNIPTSLPENLQFASDVHVMVYDWDRMDSDDFLGRFSVPLSAISEKFEENPKWYPIYAKDPSITEGEILASFQLIPESKIQQYPLVPIKPKARDCVVEMSVVGIRDLLPYDVLPISKPFIEFDCGSGAKVKTNGSSTPSSSSPHYLETLQMNLQVPDNRIYAPPINIKVYDDRLIHKPLIATRSISMSPFIPWDQDTDALKALNQENFKPTVDKIPGAKDEPEQPLKLPTLKSEPDMISLEVHDDEADNVKLRLLQTTNQDISTIQDDLSRCISQRNLPDVPESQLKGVEEEPEEKDKREILKTELETALSKPPFNVLKLYRAKKKAGRPIKLEVGEYKGKFRLFETKNKEKEGTTNLSTLYASKPYVVRLYILEGFQLVPKDAEGNNPYLKISLGKNKIKEMDQAKQVTSRPQFYKCYELPCTFPDETSLTIEVWDWDAIGSDDLIGITKIDLETRFYSEEWKAMKKKPIEFRTLWNPSSTNPQGQLKLWIDILTPEEASKNPPEPISPPVPLEYELRVIVWDTQKVVFKDKGKSSDILVVAFPEGSEPQSTDTHWNSLDGTGMFNWRLKYPITLPAPNPRFKLQVWDRNMMNPNGAICEANLNLRPFFTKVYKNKLNRSEIAKQWVTMTHPNETGPQGEVSVSIEILSLEEAKNYPAGFGREEPNNNPHLDEPNRPATSIAPWRVDKKAAMAIGAFWKANRYKIYAAIACILCFMFGGIIIAIFKFFI